MAPARFRTRSGFLPSLIGASLLGTTSAHAATISSAQLGSALPIAIVVGAVGFSLFATLMARKAKSRNADISRQAFSQMADLRAELDVVTSVLEGMPELTLMWRDISAPPTIYGQADIVLDKGKPISAAADLTNWLPPQAAQQLSEHIAALKVDGRVFDSSLLALDGRLLRVSGRLLGGVAALRVRPATLQPDVPDLPVSARNVADMFSTEILFGLVTKPAWLRDEQGRLVYANLPYQRLANSLGVTPPQDGVAEIFNPTDMAKLIAQMRQKGGALSVDKALTADSDYDMVLFPVEGGSAGFLRRRETVQAAPLAEAEGIGADSGIIDAIATPIAIFDQGRRLVHFNRAYAQFWGLDPEWLNSGVEEGAILDRLRTLGQLPSEADYRAWRAKHLSAYSLDMAREEPWYLPDGRTLNVVSVPNPANNGVIYVFEDITEQLALESRYNALIHVQSETLSALSEAVAVFGTNGRLTLSNHKLSSLWKLPMNTLGEHPHIDQMAEACAKTMPDDGATIWRDLKKSIVDLNPARSDRNGRINRADGRMIDYTVTRLPDGQTMMTFTDVTESANFQRVLKERNDALVIADRLKDAFVQNVSYELRSPLTNIIGFADLLSSEEGGALTEKQKSYIEFIRASSQTLGVLIDNILDLATADAGVAELKLEEQDVEKLVERARAGLASTLTAGGSETPPNLTVEIEPELPVFVADGTRIVQVLYNLLSNAVRFSAPGAEVKLNVSARADRLVFTVEDEGVGISEEMRAAMFQRFEGQPVEGRQRGAGLGLSIVKTFVNLHGGTVNLEKREPRGTRVVVSIPAAPAEAAGAAE